MSYINDLATNYNLEETLLKLEDGTYKKKDTSPYNKKLLHISKQQGIIARVPLGSLTNNIFLQNVGPSLSIKYKTLSLTSSNINKKIKNYKKFLTDILCTHRESGKMRAGPNADRQMDH